MNPLPVRIVIAEDEPDQRADLVRLIARLWPEAELVAECRDGDAALAALDDKLPDVLFLDIRMPGTSGIEVARAASGRSHVVLITAYEEHAVEAFEAGALDYLLKPVTRPRLAAAIERLRQRLSESPPRIEALLDGLASRLAPAREAPLRWITASCGDSVQLIPVDEVLFFRASDKYVRVVTPDGEALVRTPLKALAGKLDAQRFLRIHRSVIVAAESVERIERDELGRWHARLHGHHELLPVSERARGLFRSM